MKLSILASLVATTAAFAPAAQNQRASVSMSMDRRAAISAFGVAAATAAVPMAAFADGAVSSATINRARGIYGDRVASLKSAVAAGDFAAVAAEKNAFILFNSGAYPGAKNKAKKAAAIAGTNDIFAAIRAGDKAALSSAYGSYVAANNITELPTITNNDGQGYSTDYDFRSRSKAGAIYVR